MKAIITLMLCMSIAVAQQIPNTTTSKTKNRLEFQTTLKKWRENAKQFNTPELRKSQKYVELKQEMKKELRDIRQGKITEPTPIVQKQLDKKAEVKDVIQPHGIQTKQNMLVDTLQLHKPSLTVVPEKVIRHATCYDVPFASKGNVLELSVANISTLTTEGIKVEATNIPEGLQFKEKTVTLTALKTKEEQIASFRFSVEKTAKVNKTDTLRFTITDKTGQRWTKEIAIKIAPPNNYELFQNYPNPFNPTTAISYQLSAISNVSLKIYDVLGREVANLVNEQQEPGGHQAIFDARKFASGMYVYRLIATDDQNNHHVFKKKMLMVK